MTVTLSYKIKQINTLLFRKNIQFVFVGKGNIYIKRPNNLNELQ